MNSKIIVPDQSIARYVKSILVYNNEDDNDRTVLPFFADGYPGLIYHTAVKNMTLFPSGQLMKPFFIYGQTLHPIELVVKGRFRMVIFQLFPFALRSLFKLDALSLNEDCYNLMASEKATVQKLESVDSQQNYISVITELLCAKVRSMTVQNDLIKEAIQLILNSHGTVSVRKITEQLNVSERSLQRLFKAEAGISPKKFSKIVQFQASLDQLSKEEYSKLSQIAYEKGFADQSHFIRMFRQYTGNTPSSFVK